jgi:hypothetical protein
MRNILRAEDDWVVDEPLAVPGGSLSVDQPILRFRQPAAQQAPVSANCASSVELVSAAVEAWPPAAHWATWPR